jgi:ankyrin repeat protein
MAYYNGMTPLDEAAAKNDLVILNRLLDIGGYDRESLGLALEHATDFSAEQNLLTVKYLLEAGANPSNDALRMACASNYLSAIRYLLEYGASPHDVDDRGLSALHYVVSCEAARMILNAAPDLVTATTFDGRTPLDQLYLPDNHHSDPDYVISVPDMQLAMLLVEYGSEVGASPSWPTGSSALHRAAQLAHVPVVKAILKRQSSFLNCTDFNGDTLLHYAVCSESKDGLDCVKALVELGCDVKAWNKDRETVLHYLCDIRSHAPPEKQGAIALYLISAGVDISVVSENRWGFQGTALMRAVRNGKTTLALVLIDAGSELSTKVARWGRVQHIAAEFGDTEVVERLLRSDLDLDLSDRADGGKTALHCAVLGAIDPRRSKTAATISGYIILGYSIPEGSAALKGLIPRRRKHSPLSAKSDYIETVRLLCTCSPNRDIVGLMNNDGDSALDLVKAAVPGVAWDEIETVARIATERGDPMPEVPASLLSGDGTAVQNIR